MKGRHAVIFIYQRLCNLVNARNIVFLVATNLYPEEKLTIYEKERASNGIEPLLKKHVYFRHPRDVDESAEIMIACLLKLHSKNKSFS